MRERWALKNIALLILVGWMLFGVVVNLFIK